MRYLIAFFRLIRFQNLIIIGATQYLMRYAILETLLSNIYITGEAGISKLAPLDLQLTEFQFLSLVLSTICLTAAGYVINDYFDTKTDLLNRPEKVIVGKLIPRRWTMAIHVTLNAAGILFGFYVSYVLDMIYLGFVFILISGLLWFYSTTYKRQFLVGNILVAILAGLVPFIVVLFEIPPILQVYGPLLNEYQINLGHTVTWVGGFSFFAFFTIFLRELIKDMEDFEGDREFGRRSLPVVLGIKTTRLIVISLIFIMIISLVLLYLCYLQNVLTLIYLLLGLIIPLLYTAYRISRATSQHDFHAASNITKLIMLLGLSYALIFRYFVFTQLITR